MCNIFRLNLQKDKFAEDDDRTIAKNKSKVNKKQ